MKTSSGTPSSPPTRPEARQLRSPALVGAGALLTAALISGVAASLTAPGPVAPPSDVAPQGVSFSEQVLPIFEARCTSCHGGEGPDGEIRAEEELNLTTHEGVMTGSTWGTVVEAGDPEGSILLEMIVEGDMPSEDDGPVDPVPEEEIELIRHWISEGAADN